MKTSKNIWDEFPNKDCYEWKSSAIHSYNVLKRKEDKMKESNLTKTQKESEVEKIKKWKNI